MHIEETINFIRERRKKEGPIGYQCKSRLRNELALKLHVHS